MNNKKAIIAALIGNSIFGFSFLFSKIALDYVTPIVLLAIRFDISCLVLVALVCLKIIKVDYKNKNLKPLILLGVLQPIVYFLCENNGLQYVSSSISGVIIAVIPVITFFTGSVFLHEKFEVKQLGWAVMSVIGVSIISMAGKSEGNVQVIGLILLMGAVISAAIYNTMSRGISTTFSPLERTFMMFIMGASFFTMMAFIQTKGQFPSMAIVALSDIKFLLTVLYLGGVSSIIAFLLLNYSVSYLPVRQATSFASITSIISVVAGVIVLHETISLIQFFGIVLILYGVYKVNVID